MRSGEIGDDAVTPPLIEGSIRVDPVKAPLAKDDAPVRPSAGAALAGLEALVGPWEGTAASGRQSRVAYRVTAGDSVLVETWTQSRGREALTLYKIDGDDLLATHYFPKGDQSRLRRSGGRPRSPTNPPRDKSQWSCNCR